MNLFWHRRDLRIEDNAGLYHALKGPDKVLPIFIFDKNILDKLEDPNDARVSFIYNQVKELKATYQKYEGNLEICYGTPEKVLSRLIKKYTPQTIYTNRDYEAYALERDALIAALCIKNGIGFKLSLIHI